MFLSKYKNGYYYLYYQEGNIRRKVSTKCKSKSEALKFIALLKSDTKNQTEIPKKYSEYVKQFISYSKSIHKPNTTKAIQLTFRFFNEFIGNPYLIDITSSKINEYLQQRIINHSIYQARKDLIHLKRFFHKAEIDEYIKINPCRNIKGIRIPEKQPLFYTREEFEKLIKIVKEEDLKDLYTFAVYTGLRLDEIRYLKLDNIQSQNIILHNQSKLTKTDKVRSVPLNKKAYSIVLKRMETAREYLFTYRGFKLGKRTATQKLKVYIKLLGINPKLNFHSFRHTFASWLVQNEVSIYNVSKLLGHSNIKTTERYAHLRTDDLKKSVDLL